MPKTSRTAKVASVLSDIAFLARHHFNRTVDDIKRPAEQKRKHKERLKPLRLANKSALRKKLHTLSRKIPSADKFLALFSEWLIYCGKKDPSQVVPNTTIISAFYDLVTDVYTREGFSSEPHLKVFADSIEDAEYRDALIAKIETLAHPDLVPVLYVAFGSALLAIAQPLPPMAQEDDDGQNSLTVPLYTVYADFPRVFDNFFCAFHHPEVLKLNLFSKLRQQLIENVEAQEATMPADFNGTNEELLKAYCRGTPLEQIFHTPVPLTIPNETRFSGQWIIAPPGRGKTTLLHSMFLDDIQKDASIIVMDSKGDLINPTKSMKSIADRLILIEPDAQHPLALNPLDVPSDSVTHAIQLIEYILSGMLDAKFTNSQSSLFRHVLPAIKQAFPHPTIDDLKQILADGLPTEYLPSLDDRLRRFFEDKRNGFYSKTYQETRSQIIWRLDFILTNDTMRAMFASPITRLKIGDAMNSGKIILIDASKAILGDDGSEFYQRFFLALMLAAAQQRSKLHPSKKLPVYCYLDECQWVRNDQKLATILDECRSQKIALILAHQRTDQINNPNVLSAMANCAIRFANSDDEAKFLAPKLRCEPEFFHSLPTGTFAAFVRDMTPHAVAVKVPFVNIADFRRMTAKQQQAIRNRMRNDYGFIPQRAPSSPPTPSTPPTPLAPAVGTRQPPSTPAAQKRKTRGSASDPEAGPTW